LKTYCFQGFFFVSPDIKFFVLIFAANFASKFFTKKVYINEVATSSSVG
jgi:hypothetical protein